MCPGYINDQSLYPNEGSLERAQTISELEGINQIVCFGDFHLADLESPTSMAVSSKNIVYPELSANVINCGMSLIGTELTPDDIGSGFIKHFCQELSELRNRISLNHSDISNMIKFGSEYIVDDYQLSDDILNNIENGGRMSIDDYENSIDRIIPKWLSILPRTAKLLPLPSLKSNHFVEFQFIDEIFDFQAANDWGLKEDQIVILIHGDFKLTSMINYHYANRLHMRNNMPFHHKFMVQSSKFLFHLLTETPFKFRKVMKAYDNKDMFSPIHTNSPEGEKFISAQMAAMNFAYAARLLLYCEMAKLIDDQNPQSVNLIWDVGHDSIQSELVDQQNVWIHRKGAGKIQVDKPTLIAGGKDFHSYLGKGLSTAEAHLNSYDHGVSHVAQNFNEVQSRNYLEHFTDTYNLNEGKAVSRTQHRDSKPIREVVTNLQENNIISPVASMRPIVNISE